MGNIVPLIIGIAAAAFLYQDSKKEGIGNPVVWALFGFFFSLITIIVYFVKKSNRPALQGGSGGSLPPQQ